MNTELQRFALAVTEQHRLNEHRLELEKQEGQAKYRAHEALRRYAERRRNREFRNPAAESYGWDEYDAAANDHDEVNAQLKVLRQQIDELPGLSLSSDKLYSPEQDEDFGELAIEMSVRGLGIFISKSPVPRIHSNVESTRPDLGFTDVRGKMKDIRFNRRTGGSVVVKSWFGIRRRTVGLLVGREGWTVSGQIRPKYD